MVPQIPLSTFVVGALMPQEWGNVSLSVMDPAERGREFMDFGTLFEPRRDRCLGRFKSIRTSSTSRASSTLADSTRTLTSLT